MNYQYEAVVLVEGGCAQLDLLHLDQPLALHLSEEKKTRKTLTLA